jgi:hypothetical protein
MQGSKMKEILDQVKQDQSKAGAREKA